MTLSKRVEKVERTGYIIVKGDIMSYCLIFLSLLLLLLQYLHKQLSMRRKR